MKYDAIVIGSGAGGMSCAAALSKLGKKVLVLEQDARLGGYSQIFKRKGWSWDVGLHYVGSMGENDRNFHMFNYLTDNKVKFRKLPVELEHLHFEDFEYIFLADREAMREKLIKDFPHEKAGIEEYWKTLAFVRDNLDKFYFPRILPRPATGLLSPIYMLKWNKINVTFKEMLDKLFTDEKIKMILACQWGDYGLLPEESSFIMAAVIQNHYLDGGYYPKGKAETITTAFKETIEDAGGKTLVKSKVEQILFDRKKAIGVRLESGEEIFAKLIVSSIGVKNTVLNLIGEEIAPDTLVESAKKHNSTPASLTLYIGFEGNISEVGASESNHFVFQKDPFRYSSDPAEEDWLPPTALITFPSMRNEYHEDTNLPTGEVVSLVPTKYFEKWKDTSLGRRGEEYDELKNNITEKMLSLVEKYFPGIRKYVKYTNLSTPLTNEHYTKHTEGAVYGLAPTVDKISDINLIPHAGLGNMYFTGADILAGGVISAVVAGVMTACSIEKTNLFNKFAKLGKNLN